MSLILRTQAVRALGRSSRGVPQARSMHVDNVVGNNMPFSYDKKGPFAIKLAAFLLGGFSVPFIASWYQLRKSGAGAA